MFSIPVLWFTETWCLYGVREYREVLDSILIKVSNPATGGACEQNNYIGLYSVILIISRTICLLISWWFFFVCLFLLPLMISLLCFYCRLVILFTDELGHISHWRAIIAGSLAGMVATVVTYPTDLIKTRLIVQNRLEPSYEGILHAFYKIYHQEGLLALYRGVTPAILGKIIMGKMTSLHIVYCSYIMCLLAHLISKQMVVLFHGRYVGLQGTAILILAAVLFLRIMTQIVAFMYG